MGKSVYVAFCMVVLTKKTLPLLFGITAEVIEIVVAVLVQSKF